MTKSSKNMVDEMQTRTVASWIRKREGGIEG